MKVSHASNGWSIEGMCVATFPAGLPVDDMYLRAYYSVDPGHPRYRELRQACRFDRFVIMKDCGSFVVVPINELTTVTDL